MSELRLKFGKRLRYLRRERDITQATLAESIGRSVNFVSLLENGDSSPSFNTLEEIANALNVEIVELFKFDNK